MTFSFVSWAAEQEYNTCLLRETNLPPCIHRLMLYIMQGGREVFRSAVSLTDVTHSIRVWNNVVYH